MSLRSAYRSRGRFNPDTRSFDFEDEFGRDPIMGRYGNSSGAKALSRARIAQSASEVELARASLNAVTEPVKQMADFFQNMNSAVKQQQDLYRTGRVNAQAAMLQERINKVETYDDAMVLRSDSSLADGFEDEATQKQFEAKLRGVQGRDVARLRLRLRNAKSIAEVDAAEAEFSHLAGDPETKSLVDTYRGLATRNDNAMLKAAEAGVLPAFKERMTPQTGPVITTTQPDGTSVPVTPPVMEPSRALAEAVSERQSQETEGLLTARGYEIPRKPDGSVDQSRLSALRAEVDAGELEQENRKYLFEKWRALSQRKSDPVQSRLNPWTPDDEAELQSLEQLLDPRQRRPASPGQPAARATTDDYFNQFRNNLE